MARNVARKRTKNQVRKYAGSLKETTANPCNHSTKSLLEYKKKQQGTWQQRMQKCAKELIKSIKKVLMYWAVPYARKVASEKGSNEISKCMQ